MYVEGNRRQVLRICDHPPSARRSFASLQKSRVNPPLLCMNRCSVRYGFRAGAKAIALISTARPDRRILHGRNVLELVAGEQTLTEH